jgi:hypothetical protein
MSQRRQETRRAKQERRREQRHQARSAVRRPVATPPAAVARERPAAGRRETFWTTRNRWIVFGGLAAVIVLAIGFWIFRSVTAPLPGEHFESQGNAHLADATSPHEPYNSNPPTSGPHLPPIPKPGIYTQPRLPEDLGHFMEHGGVWVLYNCPDGCDQEVQQLTQLVNDAIDSGRPAALAPFPSMDPGFAAVAWQQLIKLDAFDGGKIDNFISRLACHYNPEGGPYCTVRRGSVKDAPADRMQDLPVIQQPVSVFGSATPAASPAASPAATQTP